MSEAFWNTEVENEVRDHEPGYKFTQKADREEFMDMVDRESQSVSARKLLGEKR